MSDIIPAAPPSWFGKLVNRLRLSVFPTAHVKEVERWHSDGGEQFRYDYALNSESLVIDLGGYRGQWASDIYARCNCRVLVCEPVKSFAERIERRFRNNPNIEVFRLALGATRRQESIALNEDQSSVYRTGPVKEIVQFEDVVTFFTNRAIACVDLMKVNIEGGEYELLPRLIETELVKKIKNIQIQFHDVGTGSEARMKEICSELSKTHKPTYQYKFVWENWVRYGG